MRENEVRGSYLTREVPGCGGRARERPEDFQVEEIPLAPPGGAGEHLYLWVEKRGLSTLEAVRRLARLAGIPEEEAGYAGLKDAQAVTRQWISLRCGREGEGRVAGEAPGEGLRVLRLERGRAKLRRGELRGNRFLLRLRGVTPEGEGRARAALGILEARGAPNGFGEQRFGAHGHSAEAGLALAAGDAEGALRALLGSGRLGERADVRLREAARRFEAGDFAGALGLLPPSWEGERRALARLAGGASPAQAARAIPGRERMLYGSALQAAWFNACLALRLERGLHDRLLAGDVAVSHASGKAWRVGEPEEEAQALARFEASPAGPLLGEKMLAARGEPAAIEAEAARRLGLGLEGAAAGLGSMGLRGGRRPYRARLEELDVRREGEDLLLGFVLPPGAYATEVLREVLKEGPPPGARLGWIGSSQGGAGA
ncbi:MAG: tRNA pseudouridine(13) synthase TruD [Nitrospinota bacterium]